ncbi:MAG TPA: O-antigen ligase family protein [Pyrinomonadaceae bacterium]|nr:O-antigen ligase family protein [Pyrinomonadaceae bacterium]
MRRGAHAAPETPPAHRFAGALIVAGLLLYAVFAPHSIAGAWIGLSFAALGWLARTLLTRRTGLRRTPFDLPLWLFVGWTLLSSLLSPETRLSLSKMTSVSTFLVFYLAQATLTRRLAVLLAGVLIASGVAGALWGMGEVIAGRGVVVEAIAPESPFAGGAQGLRKGDAVWRVGQTRVASVAEIDEAIRRTPAGTRPALHVITQGEHVVREGPIVTEAIKSAAAPSGLQGTERTHRFRASGWTRHYQTFAEILQVLAQLALGFTLARVARRRTLRRIELPAAAFLLLATGLALTAMRTVLVAFAVGACVIAWRAVAGRARVAVSLAIVVVLSLGALAVWRTRATGALRLQDDSSTLRRAVAQRALERIPAHPLFGHGMDAVNLHWQEWGFPGDETIHTHSTVVQLAFDRGLPALIFWLWLLLVFWLTLTRAEKLWRETDDAGVHGLVLGALGALAGFLASSLVNYNFGDSEVALLIWWLMGAVVVSISDDESVAGLRG